MVFASSARPSISLITAEFEHSIEHSERPLRILVDVGHYESQVHTSYHLFCGTGRCRPVQDSQLLLAERNSYGGCRHRRQTSCNIS
jgi:hypothetical protein